MAYTEKVSVGGTALSFLLYECVNSSKVQEGFLVGSVSSQITNHISDLQSDTARLDTQIEISTVLPLPASSLFYQPTGKINEEVLKSLLSASANDIVGFYKFRANNNIKPTFRDKLICKGLQKYFEKYHNKKNFVMCNVTNKKSVSGSTHTLTYRFGKINCLNMYEYIEDVTANLGEKVTGYRKAQRGTTHSVFNNIILDSNEQSQFPGDAILFIQESVNQRLAKEAKLAAKNELILKELEAEIKQMHTIISDKHADDLNTAYNQIVTEKLQSLQKDIALECAVALRSDSSPGGDIGNMLCDTNHVSDASQGSVHLITDDSNNDRSPSPLLLPSKNRFNYAAALKKNTEVSSSSVSHNQCDDLITFDQQENPQPGKQDSNVDDKCYGDSSPEY